MDTDDDFMGEIEFELAQDQGEIVRRAIELAANLRTDEFDARNPLIAIMQWWEHNVPEAEKLRATPEKTLTEACRRFLLAHRSSGADREST
jgi:hypothetical protein